MQPARLADFEPFEGEGFHVHVERATLAAAEEPGVVRFNFGAFGWCELRVMPSARERPLGPEGGHPVSVAPTIEVLVFEGCPHADAALGLARRVADRLTPAATVHRVDVDTAEKAAALGFLGSPSIRVDGRDLEGRRTSHGALCCRTYEGGAGVPPEWLLEAALLRALGPRGILFLCVANSARSQIAEGIARTLAPAIKVWSAGSRPTRVRPEAIAVLAEIGLDISSHRSKAVEEIPAAEVDTVITLCGEEECPLFLGNARRLHWGLPDPAAVTGSDEERRDAFRRTRDELRRRLELLLASGEDGASSPRSRG